MVLQFVALFVAAISAIVGSFVESPTSTKNNKRLRGVSLLFVVLPLVSLLIAGFLGYQENKENKYLLAFLEANRASGSNSLNSGGVDTSGITPQSISIDEVVNSLLNVQEILKEDKVLRQELLPKEMLLN